MTETALYHPDLNLLQEFLEGLLPIGINMAVSAHVDDCFHCRQLLPALGEVTSNDWYDNSQHGDAPALDDILANVMAQPTQPLKTKPEILEAATVAPALVQMRDREVALPRVLAQAAKQGLEWNTVANGIHQALLDIDPITKCEFIYMEPGAKVPRHTHAGNEFMLVLDGSIADDQFQYRTRDFVASSHTDCHSQQTDDGCICLFVTDAPLLFTEGLLRFLNPINRIRFWWQSFRAESTA